MKNRLLNNWTFPRVLYVLMGSFVVVQSVLQSQWFGVLFGLYFAAMGLFAFGCAAGNCGVNLNSKAMQNHKDVEFEEVSSEIVKK